MKVGIVVPYSWSFWGGVQEHADQLGRALAQLGVEAKIVMGHDPPGRLTRLLHPRAGRHDRPPDYVLPVGRSVIAPANASLPNIVLSPQALLRMKRIFERERFDVVHVHEPLAPVLSTAALALAPCPIVATFHSAGEDHRWYPLGMRLWRTLVERIDYRIAVSDAAHRAASRFIPGPFEVIPNGVLLPPAVRPDGRELSVAFVGRHEQRKGLPVLLRAWPLVRARTGARLRVIGADPLSVRWLMRRQGIGDEGIDLLGSVSEEERTGELARASLLAAPALKGESFGLILIEAFSCATPVVASDTEGYNQIVQDDLGLLVPPGDHEALAAAIVSLLQDETRRCELGANARRVAEERYSWDTIAPRILEIYRSLAAGRHPDLELAACR